MNQSRRTLFGMLASLFVSAPAVASSAYQRAKNERFRLAYGGIPAFDADAKQRHQIKILRNMLDKAEQENEQLRYQLLLIEGVASGKHPISPKCLREGMYLHTGSVMEVADLRAKYDKLHAFAFDGQTLSKAEYNDLYGSERLLSTPYPVKIQAMLRINSTPIIKA